MYATFSPEQFLQYLQSATGRIAFDTANCVRYLLIYSFEPNGTLYFEAMLGPAHLVNQDIPHIRGAATHWSWHRHGVYFRKPIKSQFL